MVAGHTTTSTFIVENVNMLSGGISWFPYKALIIWITMWFYIHTTTGLKSHSSSTIRCHILWFSMAMAKAKVLSWARGSWNVSGEKNRVDGSFGVVKITMRLGVSWYKIYIDIPETRCIHAYVYDLYFNDTRKVGTSTNGFDFQGRLMTVHLMIPHYIYIWWWFIQCDRSSRVDAW